MSYTYIVLYYLLRRSKAPFTHAHTHTNSHTTVENTGANQEQYGVQCHAQGLFDTWADRVETQPLILRTEIDCSTAAIEAQYFYKIIKYTITDD